MRVKSSLPCQVLSPLAKNLFHRAISESGVVLTTNLDKKNTQAVAQVGPDMSIPAPLSGLPLDVPWLFWLWGAAEIINS